MEEIEDRPAVERDQGFLPDSTSMAMTCCHKECVEVCEILVSAEAPAPHSLTLYNRLRFGLLTSSWLPSPLGVFLWSALHVMLLIVGGPILWVLRLLATFLICSVIWFSFEVICFASYYVVYGLLTVAVDLVLLLVESIRFCWSIVGSLACHEPIAIWKGGARWTVEFWEATLVDFRESTREDFRPLLQIGVPCMSKSLYKETKVLKFITWARWCEEVVHMHDAIAV